MLGYILSGLDILAGISIAGQTYWAWNPITWLGIIMLIKGGWSIATSATSRFYLDFIGWIDIIAAVMILANLQIEWIFLAPLLKGIYSFVMIRM